MTAPSTGPARWYRDGLRFECAGCGNCCRTHGEYAYVYLNRADVAAISRYLGIDGAELLADFCETDDDWVYFRTVQADCLFLDDDNRCRIYPVRPKQCATWPFWSENLDPEAWEGPVAACCPGVGRGGIVPAAEMERLAHERDEWYSDLYEDE